MASSAHSPHFSYKVTGWLLGALLMGLTTQAQGSILTPSGYVAPEAAQICQLFANEHGFPLQVDSKHYSALEALHAFAENNLRRPHDGPVGNERAYVHHDHWLLAPLTQEQRQQLSRWFDRLSEPTLQSMQHQTFDYILIYGTTNLTLHGHIDALSQSLQQKKFDIGPGTQVIFFDGERPPFAKETLEALLNPKPFSAVLIDSPQTDPLLQEVEAGDVADRQLWLPAALRHVPVSFIYAPLKPGDDGTPQHSLAASQLAVRHWLETMRPQHGRALLIAADAYGEGQRLATLLALQQSQGPAIELVVMEAEVSADDPLSNQALGARLNDFVEGLAIALHMRQLAEQGIQSNLMP